MAAIKKLNFRKIFSAEFMALTNAIHRCHNPQHAAYSNYGARGITVAEQWHGPLGFYTFLEHVGPRPTPLHTLDRIDNNQGYKPGNVRWADRTTQANNRRSKNRHLTDYGWGIGKTLCKTPGPGHGRARSPNIPYKGGIWTLVDACRDKGIEAATVRQRLARGLTPEQAMDLPLHQGRKITEVIAQHRDNDPKTN